MRSFERYTIDFSHKTEPGGTHEKPKLLAITSGERTGDSLVFHFKIGTFYQQMHINKVNKNGTVNLKCISVYCKATAKLRVDIRFLKIFPNFHKRTDGRFRSKFSLDYSDGALRNLQNWEVIFHVPKFCVVSKQIIGLNMNTKFYSVFLIHEKIKQF